MDPTANNNDQPPKAPRHPFRAALVRGLGVVLPPLFTILIFAWVIDVTYRHVLSPVTTGVQLSGPLRATR